MTATALLEELEWISAEDAAEVAADLAAKYPREACAPYTVIPATVYEEEEGCLKITNIRWGGNETAQCSTPFSVLKWDENDVAQEWLKPPAAARRTMEMDATMISRCIEIGRADLVARLANLLREAAEASERGNREEACDTMSDIDMAMYDIQRMGSDTEGSGRTR